MNNCFSPNRSKLLVELRLHSSETPPPLFKGGESENCLKRGGSMMQGQVFLKGGRGDGAFSIYFFQGLLILHLKIALPFAKLCYIFK